MGCAGYDVSAGTFARAAKMPDARHGGNSGGARVKHRVSQAWHLIPGPVRAPFEVISKTISLYIEDSCSTYAAAIAYYAIFSIVPLSLITISLVGLVADRDRIADWVFEQIPLEESETVRNNVDEIIRRAQDFSPASLGFGIIFLIWSSSGIFGAVRKGLNAAAHLKLGRPYWRSKLMDFALIPIVGVLIAVSVGLTAFARNAAQQFDEIGPFPLNENLAIEVASYAIPAAITFLMFILLSRFAPAARPRGRDALGGAILATVLFEIAKNLIAIVISESTFSRDTAIYAGFGTALAFLVWMFVNASILLLGAEFGRAIRLRRDIALGVPLENEVVSPEFVAAPGSQQPQPRQS